MLKFLLVQTCFAVYSYFFAQKIGLFNESQRLTIAIKLRSHSYQTMITNGLLILFSFLLFVSVINERTVFYVSETIL